MNAQQFRHSLLTIFGAVHVDAWMAKQPPSRVYAKNDVNEFIQYLNSLPPMPFHEDELARD